MIWFYCTRNSIAAVKKTKKVYFQKTKVLFVLFWPKGPLKRRLACLSDLVPLAASVRVAVRVLVFVLRVWLWLCLVTGYPLAWRSLWTCSRRTRGVGLSSRGSISSTSAARVSATAYCKPSDLVRGNGKRSALFFSWRVVRDQQSIWPLLYDFEVHVYGNMM